MSITQRSRYLLHKLSQETPRIPHTKVHCRLYNKTSLVHFLIQINPVTAAYPCYFVYRRCKVTIPSGTYQPVNAWQRTGGQGSIPGPVRLLFHRNKTHALKGSRGKVVWGEDDYSPQSSTEVKAAISFICRTWCLHHPTTTSATIKICAVCLLCPSPGQ